MKSFIFADLMDLWQLCQRRKYPIYLLLLLSFNLIVAPAVYGATGLMLAKNQAYALGLLGIVTIALAIYLFVVMFQPERF
jgi:K+-transporting ATPase KdpF subunit